MASPIQEVRHEDEPNPVSARTVDARVLRALRNRGAVPGGAAGGALAARLRLPEVRRCGAYAAGLADSVRTYGGSFTKEAWLNVRVPPELWTKGLPVPVDVKAMFSR
jgi:hypothetical protein